jgi:hypothetical protein
MVTNILEEPAASISRITGQVIISQDYSLYIHYSENIISLSENFSPWKKTEYVCVQVQKSSDGSHSRSDDISMVSI